MSNLAHKQEGQQGNLVDFPKRDQGAKRAMYSDKFNQGYVMSSRLYRKEVWPFISDAARNVYAELENRINGHNKESDFVSYSQLQGGELEGARKLGRKTVAVGLKELQDFGVITVVASGRQGMKSYKINEISLKDQFTNKTSSASELVSPQNQNGTASEPTTSSASEHTIDNLKENLNKKEKEIPAENFEDGLFVEYLPECKDLVSLKWMYRKNPNLAADLRAQAEKLNPELPSDLITAEIMDFAQWSLTRTPSTATPQEWMNFWIRRIRKLKVSNSRGLKPQVNSKQPQAKKFTGLSDSQCNVFANKICADDNFASQYAEVGETQKQFVSRITEKLKDPAQVLEWADYLRAVGFEGNLGEQA